MKISFYYILLYLLNFLPLAAANIFEEMSTDEGKVNDTSFTNFVNDQNDIVPNASHHQSPCDLDYFLFKIQKGNDDNSILLACVLENNISKKESKWLISSSNFANNQQKKVAHKAYSYDFSLVKNNTPNCHVVLTLIDFLEKNGLTLKDMETNFELCTVCGIIAIDRLGCNSIKKSQKGCLNSPFPDIKNLSNLTVKYLNRGLSLSFAKKFFESISANEKNSQPVQDMQASSNKNSVQKKPDLDDTTNQEDYKEEAANQKSIIDTLKTEKELIIQEATIRLLSYETTLKEKNNEIEKLLEIIKVTREAFITYKSRKVCTDMIKRKWQIAFNQDNVDDLRIIYRSYQIDIDKQEAKTQNWTYLHYACSKGNMSLIEFLVEECQASVNLRTFQSVTPLAIAKHSKRSDIVIYLEKHGAKM